MLKFIFSLLNLNRQQPNNKIPDLPIEILVYIAKLSVETWKSMINIPAVTRIVTQEEIRKHFIRYDELGNTLINGKYHSVDDKPIIINNKMTWYKNGIIHRGGDQPSIIDQGSRYWYKNGVLHRDFDLPAMIIYPSGNKRWYKNGLLHRDGGNPAVINYNGYQEWWIEGKYIRKDILHIDINNIYSNMSTNKNLKTFILIILDNINNFFDTMITDSMFTFFQNFEYVIDMDAIQ